MYPTNRVECVYDRCAYRKCKNGKYYNGKHLFRFPVEKDPRHKVWIKNSGNHLLRVWSASTIRRSGLCEDHFSPDSFINEKHQRLKRNAIPIPYNDSLQATQNSAIKKTDADGNDSSLLKKEEIKLMKNREVGEEIQEEGKFVNEETIKDEEKIIEEDILVYEIYEETDEIEDRSKDQENVVVENNSFHQMEQKIADYDDINTIWKNTLKRTYSSRALPRQTTADKDNPMDSTDIESSPANIAQPANVIKLPVNVKEINDKDVIIDSLKKENNFLRQQMQLLKMKLRRNLRKVQLENTGHQENDFLNKYMNGLGLEPIAKAMVKLQLHKPNTPYTEDEKLLTKQLYYHSAIALSELRKAGCNIPAESVIEKWMTEHVQS